MKILFAAKVKIHFVPLLEVKIHFVPLLEMEILSSFWAKVEKESAAGPKLVILRMRRKSR